MVRALCVDPTRSVPESCHPSRRNPTHCCGRTIRTRRSRRTASAVADVDSRNGLQGEWVRKRPETAGLQPCSKTTSRARAEKNFGNDLGKLRVASRTVPDLSANLRALRVLRVSQPFSAASAILPSNQRRPRPRLGEIPAQLMHEPSDALHLLVVDAVSRIGHEMVVGV